MARYDPFQDFLDDQRKIWAVLAAGAGLLLLVACSDARTVAYYRQHAPERTAKLDRCLARGSETADCLNARQAEFEARGIPAKDGQAL
jgi:hypothetical protein